MEVDAGCFDLVLSDGDLIAQPYIVGQRSGKFPSNLKVPDKVFFSPDSKKTGIRHTFPGGWGYPTLGNFELFKMAAKMAAKI